MFAIAVRGSLAMLITTLVATFASAGLVDTPIPLIDGEKVRHVFSVTGVTSVTDGLDTVFFCTSIEKSKEVTIAVEIFDFDGVRMNDVTTIVDSDEHGVIVISPGETAAIETNFDGNDVAAIDDDAFIVPAKEGNPGDKTVNHGAARILATSNKLLCTAALVARDGSPPESMASLNVFKKTSQKGD